eukprot:COSAG06_NODE_5771_length_3280_cov_6.097139_2_plen_33_part_00
MLQESLDEISSRFAFSLEQSEVRKRSLLAIYV